MSELELCEKTLVPIKVITSRSHFKNLALLQQNPGRPKYNNRLDNHPELHDPHVPWLMSKYLTLKACL